MNKDLLEKLISINKAKRELEQQEKAIREEVEKCLTEDGYKDEHITISYTKPTSSTTVDLKKLEENEPELYEDLLTDYPKVTNRKASYKYIIK